MDLLTSVVLLAGLLTGSVLVLRTPTLRPARPGTGAPSVGSGDHVVVIPARNEASVLPSLLDDLARQTAPAARVVVVDDGSSDGTAAVATGRDGVEVRRAPPTPAGWNPKTWALHHGVAGAEERTIVFLDADVRLAAEAIASVLASLERHGGVVSVAPRHDVGSAIEGLSLPFNLVAVMGAGRGWTPTRPAARAAFGPCLAVRTAGYAAMGGHAADRGDLLDDVALARRAAAAGEPVTLHRGGPLVRYRMYAGGPRHALEGWTKNIAAGARRTPLVVAVGVGAWVTAVLLPLALLASVSVGWAAVAWAVVSLHTGLLSRSVGRFGGWAAPAAPLLAVVFVAVVARSAVALSLGRPVRWKGRDLVQPRGGARGT